MEEVKVYKTRDGERFDTPAEARRHESLLDLADWYEDNKLYGAALGCRIEWEDFIEWVRDNPDELSEMLSLTAEH